LPCLQQYLGSPNTAQKSLLGAGMGWQAQLNGREGVKKKKKKEEKEKKNKKEKKKSSLSSIECCVCSRFFFV
jgi:hypothetical protein